METFSLDIDAEQIVRWLIDERRAGKPRLDVFATRSYVVEALTERESRSFGEDEAEELSDVLAVGVLEVCPPAAYDGWLLRLRVEDRIGPRAPEEDDISLEDEEIDLDTFETEFIRPGRGTADVTLEAEDAQGKARFTRLFKNMLRNEHPAATG